MRMMGRLAVGLVAGSLATVAAGQSRSTPATAAPVAAGAHLFQVAADSPLAARNGRPKWEVYNDCSWANYNALKAAIKAESEQEAKEKAAEQAAAARQGNPATASVFGGTASLANATERRARMLRNQEIQAVLSKDSDTLTARAIDAHAALTGKKRDESKALVDKTDPVATLTVEQCKSLVP